MRPIFISLLLFGTTLSGPAVAAGGPQLTEQRPYSQIKRLPIEGARFPIAAAVLVPGELRTLYVSGQLPDALARSAQIMAAPDYGTTEQQTRSVLDKIEVILKRGRMELADVVQMRVFLVGDASMGNRMDFAGMIRAYNARFGTAQQPTVPARTVVQVVGLPLPGALVEIDVIASKGAKR